MRLGELSQATGSHFVKSDQLDFSDIWEKAALRLAICENLAAVFGEVELDDACRCQCRGKVRCDVNPTAGWTIVWCDRCG